MIKKTFSAEEISEIISKLKIKFPEYEIHQCGSEPEFIRFTKSVGYSTFQTENGNFKVAISSSENVHIFECNSLI